MADIDRQAYLRLVRGELRGPIALAGRLGLSGLSPFYGLGVRARNLAYDRNWKSIARADVPVIAVGNLTLGGTGKTPMVEWIARWFREKDKRAAILSRGYGQDYGLNDEGRVLEENLPDVPHLQGADRSALARIAVDELESEILILDDGFQHRRLARDLDIVLLDALDPFGLGRMFPRGLLREPIASLRRANLVVISRADLVTDEARQSIRTKAEAICGPLPWAEARHAPIDLIDAEGNSLPLSVLEGKSALAFCGLGNPEGFRRTLAGLGVESNAFVSFPDHHPYDRADVVRLIDQARGASVDLALTTQKDLVKLQARTLGSIPLYALRIGLEFVSGRDRVEAALATLLARG